MSSTVKGKYVIERRLGGGGMAEVFLARTIGAEGFSRPVAIKRVLAGFSDRPDFARMFISEAQITSRLQHPSIVSILDFDRDDEGRLFLVLELVEGTDLDGLLQTGPLPFSVVIYIAIQILRGLDYAHALPVGRDGLRGIVHRDISPHNVLLSWEGAVKVSDFGIAKAHAASSASASAFIKGKPAYMSPEQANGQPLDGRSDLFAVGVMLFEMLALQPLFAGSTTQETFARLLLSPIPDIRTIRPDVPEDLARILASLLVRDPQLRTPSAEVAIAALLACENHPRGGQEELVMTLSQRFTGRMPIRARGSIQPLPPEAATLVTPPIAPTPGRMTRTMPPDEHPVRRRRLWPVVVLLVAAIGAGGAIVATTRVAKPIAPPPPASTDTGRPTPAGSAAQVPAVRTRSGDSVAPAASAPKSPPASPVVTEDSASSPAREPTGTSTVQQPTHEFPTNKPTHRLSRAKQNSDSIQEIHLSNSP